MRRIAVVGVLCASAVITWVSDASAHGIAGKRFFPATLTTDDPFVADELSLPTISTTTDSGIPATRDTDVSVDIAKRITPDLGIEFGATWKHVTTPGQPSIDGFDNLAAGIKYKLFQDDAHESIFSVGVDADIGSTGAVRVGAEKFSTITPSVFLGKGFGDLPDNAKFLRPFAITAVAGLSIPTRTSTIMSGGDIERQPNNFNLGFAIEYSLPYLQSFVQDVGLGAPFNRIIPLVEVSLQTPINRGEGGKTTGTINPGFIWAGQTFQLGLEAIVPVNARTGSGVGVIFQAHFFLDDLFPTTLGRPLFGGGKK